MASQNETVLMHGTCVALGDRAAAIRGKPGAGKSDLALRFISAFHRDGAALVADDQIRICREQNILSVSAPESIAGLFEVRGIGVISFPPKSSAELALIIELSPADEIERMPPDPWPREKILGISVPVLRLFPFEASAAAKLYAALGGVFAAPDN